MLFFSLYHHWMKVWRSVCRCSCSRLFSVTIPRITREKSLSHPITQKKPVNKCKHVPDAERWLHPKTAQDFLEIKQAMSRPLSRVSQHQVQPVKGMTWESKFIIYKSFTLSRKDREIWGFGVNTNYSVAYWKRHEVTPTGRLNYMLLFGCIPRRV